MRSQIYLPLRSNAAWFGTSEKRADLERQFKVNLMLYDRLILENGRWRMAADAGGQGMTSPLRSSWLAEEQRRHVSYFTPGGTFGIQVGGTSVLSGIASDGYEADFYPILYDAKLLDTACYDWIEGELKLSGDGERQVRELVDNIVRCHDGILPKNRYVRRNLVEGLIKDTLLSLHLKIPISIDFEVAPVVAKLHEASMIQSSPELRQMLYNHWIELDLPDFGEWTWDNVLEARESPAGIAFRDMIARLCNDISTSVASGAARADVSAIISKEFSKELIKELNKRRTTPGSTVVGLLSNFIPGGAFISGARDLLALGQEGHSWCGVVDFDRNRKRRLI